MQICGWPQAGEKKFARIYRRFKFIANYYKPPQPPVAVQRARGQIIIGCACFIIKVDQIHMSRLRPDQYWLV